MTRTDPLPARIHNRFLNFLLLSLYRSPDFPARLRIFTNLERLFGSKRICARSKYGFFMAVDREDIVQRSVLDTGLWEQECSDAIRRELNPQDVFFDVGCNVGYHTLLALTCGVRKVVSFDPDPANCDALHLNLGLNKWNFGHCSVECCGVGDKESSEVFYRSQISNTGQSGFLARNVSKCFKVSVITLDALIGSGAVPPPTVMKLDVEGWESRVLKGFENFLHKAPPRFIFFECNSESGVTEKNAVWSILGAAGYHITRVEDREFRIHSNFVASHPI
jgi:FkbM family methyltransferase